LIKWQSPPIFAIIINSTKLYGVMNNFINLNLLEIIKKHIGMTVFCIYRKTDGLSFCEGKLMFVDQDIIVIDNPGIYKDRITLKFSENGRQNILHLYQDKFIDLITAKETPTLNKKLRDNDLKKNIMSNLKKHIEKEVYFVYKANNRVALSLSKFMNMGISDILCRVAPFFNQDVRLRYENILHVYNLDGVDLLG
jgi:hypothetical protein